MMSGASYWDILATFKIGRSTCYKVFHEVLAICDRTLAFESLPPKMEVNLYYRRAMEFAMSRSSFNVIPGCVGALDGTIIFLQKPSKELSNQQFYTRKGGFGIPVHALVDAKYRFIASSAIRVGSTVDNAALFHSNIGQFLLHEGLPDGFWIAGDEAYRCSKYIITPIPRSMANKYQDGFNFCLSSHLVHVEQAFGRLKSRRGILWRPLQFNLQTPLLIVNTAMRLENVCINSGDAVNLHSLRGSKFELEARNWLGMWLVWFENGYHDFFDPLREEDMESASSASSCSAGFEDTYSVTRVRLGLITERLRFVRPTTQ